MKIIVCTLFEGDYHLGVATLGNSLVRAGFEGDIWVGHRGSIPSWATTSPLFDRDTSALQVTADVALKFVEVDPEVHLTYYKATFMKHLLDAECAEPEDAVAYLDPDIVMTCDWTSFSGFFEEPAVSVIEDVNHYMPARHPKRLQWASQLGLDGYRVHRDLERYYNAGFVGVAKKHADFLDEWQRVSELVIAYNGESHSLVGDDAGLFSRTDQDALNFALMASEVPINSAGREAMDFEPGGNVLSHAAGHYKPWRKGHIRRAVQGHPPSSPTKNYLAFASGPIRAVPAGELESQRRAARAASLIGRFYRRA